MNETSQDNNTGQDKPTQISVYSLQDLCAKKIYHNLGLFFKNPLALPDACIDKISREKICAILKSDPAFARVSLNYNEYRLMLDSRNCYQFQVSHARINDDAMGFGYCSVHYIPQHAYTIIVHDNPAISIYDESTKKCLPKEEVPHLLKNILHKDTIAQLEPIFGNFPLSKDELDAKRFAF